MRAIVLALVGIGIGLAVNARAAEGFGPAAVAAEARVFRLGKLELVALHDAQFVAPNDAKVFGVDVGAPAVADLLKSRGLADDRVTLSVNALLVKTAGRVVLLDSGLGPKAHGSLQASLQSAGIAPETVTDVVITHTHGDHVGGLVDADGKLAFPKATIRMSAPEWEWMKSQPTAAELVKAITPRVITFAPGKPIAPGITPVALDGHTPGHMGYEIVSGKQRLLDIGDLAHSSVVSLAKPAWTMGFDSDAVKAKATRQSTLARLAASGELVFAPHFPFPGVGHVAAAGAGFDWKPGVP
ncbi:MAG: MBL fold metallo-hydrolase [Proteobacteria bacterium]|nr:MBL fold metallo-hydrolase [Pseudomonadota bacterium]